jgi:hypothetical protein
MSIPTPNWYRDIELRIMKLEENLANLNAQVQSMDFEILAQVQSIESEILLLQTGLSELKAQPGEK